MGLNADWDYELVDDLTGGLNLSEKPHKIDKSQLVKAENVFFKNGRVVVDTGYTTFQETVIGNPRVAFQFFKTTGSSELILITNERFYTETNDSWYLVSNGTSTTLSGAAVATDTVLNVTSSTGFTAGEPIGITLDDGTQHKSTIASTGAGTITIDDQMPSGAAIGNTVLESIALNGIDDEQVSLVVLPAFNYLVFTNGQDIVQQYTGSLIQDVQNLPSSGNTKCKAVAVYENHLLLLHTIEGGTAYPQRVRRSDTGDPTEWVTGNAGFTDLLDSEDFIVTSAPLGPYQIIYRERSIVRMEFIGSEDRLFNFDTVVSGEGAASVDAVADTGTEHVFVGNANIYEYRGGLDIEPIGDEVWDKLFGNDGEIDPSYKSRITLIFVEELDEIWIFYPTSSSSTNYPDKMIRLNLSKRAWSERVFPVEISGFGFYQTSTATKWNELVGTWLQQTFKWGSAKLTANSPTTFLLDPSADQVLEYDYVQDEDNGTTITWEIETKDFFNPSAKLRHDWFEFSAKGQTVLVEYSSDEGSNWTTMKTVTLTSEFVKHRVSKQFVRDKIRFRMSGTGPGFQLEWFGFKYKLESLH